jgi:two-component system, OmpR family, sensor kinase
MRRRLSLRARLAAAFAAALLLVLALAGLFVYLRVSSSLTETIDDGLESRAADIRRQLEDGGTAGLDLEQTLIGAEEGLAQVLTPGGRVIASTVEPEERPVLDGGQLAEARGGWFFTDEDGIAGVDGEARLLAGPAQADGRSLVVVSGASAEDRDEALAGIAGAFLVGAPLAVLLASGLGYLLAARSLAPVEAMRRRADEINLEHSGERLPLSPARDEIRRLGETLNAMLDRIERSLERERVFVADASHELRTPLTVLRAELELAERPGRTKEELEAAVGSAIVEVDRLARLAEDLLVIARSDGGRLPIKSETVEVAPLLERVRRRAARVTEQEGRRVTADADPGLRAELDQLRIEQALGNLVGNAAEHGEGEIRISAQARGAELVLEVTDEGDGFPESFEDIAFERFSRAEPGRTGGGAGLGLAIVRAIAEAHGGTAEISAAQGAGTTVRITVPLGG